MSYDVVKYAFIAGEISPTLYGRTDLTKYDLAVAEGRNYFVDYRGGLSSRPGFEFNEFVKEDTRPTKFVPFSFSPDLANNYVLLFGHNYVRFIQDGAYVLQSARTITSITNANPAVITGVSGMTAGRWIKITGAQGMPEVNGRTFELRNGSGGTWQLYTVPDLQPFDSTSLGAYTGGGQAFPIYEVTTLYPAEDLAELNFDQYRDLVRLTHKKYPIYNLTRIDHDDWTFATETISPSMSGPIITTGSGQAPDPDADPPEQSASVIFTITYVNSDGDESVNGNLYRITGIKNYTVTEGSATVTWNPRGEAEYYNVYRSIVASSATLYEGSEVGYVGKTYGTSFTDPNIIADFSKTPPIKNNPFAPGAIERIEVLNGGSGYTPFSATVSVSGGGTGFVGQAVVGADGQIVNVIIKDPGQNYINPTVSFGGGGSGATASAEARPRTGIYPSLSTIFQQRQIYAASENQPITIWGSRYKRFNNFDTSFLVLDDDSFEFDLDTRAIAPIRHLLNTRGGLLLFTQENVFLLNGGTSGQAITPTNALADPQTYTGVTDLRPMPIDSDILFREGKGYSVKLLSYNEISKVYAGEDRSILSNHLLGLGKDIKAWAYQEAPFKVVWCVREDGALLAFTLVKAEDVYAWTPCFTQGKFLDIISIREGTTDRIYVVTQRLINGRWSKFVERMSLREFTNVEDAWCVDAGLSLGATYPDSTITIYREVGEFDEVTWRAKSSSAVFAGSLNKWLRGGQGIFQINQVVSSTEVVLTCYAEPLNFIPETDNSQTFPIESGSWTLDTATSSLGNLWHLEGEMVSILGDGNVFEEQRVTNGAITLDHPVTRAIVGLGYECRAKTLPLVIPDAGIEAKRKRVVGLGIRLDKTRGLKNGYSLDNLYEMRERTTEPMGRPTKLINGVMYQMISSNWDENGQTYFVLDKPLPATLLSIVFDMEVGDDPD